MVELQIKGLKVKAYDKLILNGVNLTLKGGEVHAVMGPNGTGKSTLASAIMGNPKFEVTDGQILLNGDDVLEMSVDQRAQKGIFLAMQYPAEVPGVTNSNFIKTAVNATRFKKPTVTEFLKELDQAVETLKMRPDLPHRYLNDGFFFFFKKRNEILQMLMLKPKVVVLDEIDSGLDIDALKIVGEAVAKAVNENMAVLIITHYQRILDYVKPTCVHIMHNGKITKSGGLELIERIEKEGYDFAK